MLTAIWCFFDTQTGVKMLSIPTSLKAPGSLAFDAKKQRLLVVGQDEDSTVLMALDAGQAEPGHAVRVRHGPVDVLSWSVNGRYLIAGGTDRTEIAGSDGGIMIDTQTGGTEPWSVGVYSPKGFFSIAREDRVNRFTSFPVISLDSGVEYGHRRDRLDYAHIDAIDANPVTGEIATAGTGVVLWDWTGQRVKKVLVGLPIDSTEERRAQWGAGSRSSNTVRMRQRRPIAFSSDGKLLAAGCYARKSFVGVWDCMSGELVGGLPACNDVAFSIDGEFLLWPQGNELIIQGVKNQERVALSGHAGPITSVSVSAVGKLIATGSEDQTVRLWDYATKNEICTIRNHRDKILETAFSPDGRLLAIATAAGMVHLKRVDYLLRELPKNNDQDAEPTHN